MYRRNYCQFKTFKNSTRYPLTLFWIAFKVQAQSYGGFFTLGYKVPIEGKKNFFDRAVLKW